MEKIDTLLSPTNNVVQEGDMIFYMESKDIFKPLKIKTGEMFQNRFGHFYHDDFIGKPLGSRIISRSKNKNNKESFVVIMDFVPSFWDKTGERLTQILYCPDISLILNLLNIKSNDIIMESGTGSGCLSINIANCLEDGHLFTFEFNKERADKVLNQIKDLDLTGNITITHQDVIENGFSVTNIEEILNKNDSLKELLEIKETKGITPDEALNGKVDGLFIDLPSPWEVVKFVDKRLKRNGKFVSFSPCIEQIEKTIEELKKYNFAKARVYEIVYRAYNYVKSETIKIPVFGEKRNLGEIKTRDEVVTIASSRNDMRGHTGYLLYSVKY